MAITVGCFNRPWNALPLDEAFQHIVAAGFDHAGLLRQNKELVIGPDTPRQRVEEVGAMARAAGVTLDALMIAIPLDRPAAEAADLLVKQAENAAAVGARYLLTMGTKEEKDLDAWCDAASLAATRVAQAGALLTVKNHGGITMTGSDAANVARAVDSPYFGIFYDPGNVAYYTGTYCPDDAKAAAERVVGVCVKGVRLDGPKPAMDVVPGDGAIDYVAVFDILLSAGFDGPVLVECTGGEGAEQVDACATRAREMLRDILRV